VQQFGDSSAERSGLSRRAFLGRAGGIGATVMMGSVLVACGGSDSGGSGSGSKLDTVKITLPSDVTLVLWAVDYLSEDLGYYEEEGIAVERVPFAGGPLAMQGLLSNAGNTNLQTPGEALAAISRDQPVKALMAHTNKPGAILIVSEAFAKQIGVTADDSLEAKIAALGSVKGARWAITAPGSQTDGLTRMAVKQFGLDPDKDAQIVPLQTAANNLPALQNNRIDGFIAQSPVPEQAFVELRAVPLLSVAEGDVQGGDRLAGQTLFARSSDLDANPELFSKLVRANVRALRVLVETPDKARDTLRKTRFADIDKTIWPLMWENNLPTWRSPYVSADSLSAWVENGLVADVSDPSELSLDDAIESRFVDQAVKSIGWNAPKA
jgi:NitT/TauT family transport system substrate-binding protein